MTLTAPVVTSKLELMPAVRSVGLLTVVGTCESRKTKTVPVVNLLMFPMKIFPANVIGSMKLLPCTVIWRFEAAVGPAETCSADAGLMVKMPGAVTPIAKSLPRLLLFVRKIVFDGGEAVKPMGSGVRVYVPGGRSRNKKVPAKSVAVVN